METLSHGLVTCFAVVVIVSNILSAKMLDVPFVGSMIPAGGITYPFSFLISNLMTELFGVKKARYMVYICFAASFLSFLMIGAVLLLPGRQTVENQAFHITLGLSALRFFSSMLAYVVSQIADIQVYAFIKKLTGGRRLWMCSNGSTIFSQLIDTLILDILFLYFGLGMRIQEVIGVMAISIGYKTVCSIAMTPLFYLSLLLLKARIARRGRYCDHPM